MNFRNFFYALTCLSFTIILGAAIYEHVALWPAAFAEPPRSLSVFQGPFKLDPAAFWIPVHPVTILFFVVSLFIFWKTPRRKFLVVPLIGYAVILLTTFIYFVPELIDLTTTPYNNTVDPSLQARGERWIFLSVIRAIVLALLAITLFLGLTKSDLSSRVS